MKIRHSVITLILATVVMAGCLRIGDGGSSSTPPPANPQTSLWALAYYPSYKNTMPISAIPFNSLTHIAYFGLVPAHSPGTSTCNASGSCGLTEGTPGTLTDPFGLLLQSPAFVRAAHAAGVKALLSIGGDTSVDAPLGFQQAMLTASSRTNLVNNIVTAMAQDGYDGVDINWESIRFPADVSNFQTFITQLRAALDQKAPPTHYVLGYPAGTASDYPNYTNNANMIFPVQNAIDQINLQTYGMAGAFPGWVTWHNSPLYAGTCIFPGQPPVAPPSVDQQVQAFIAAGISKSKIGIGIQLDAMDWAGGSGTTTGGASQPCQTWTRDPTINSVTAATVITNYTAANGYTANFDPVTQSAWLSNDQPGSANDHFVSVENSQSIQAKGNYLKSLGLGGAIIFEVSGDYLPTQPAGDAQHPLMTAIRQYVMH